MLNVLTTNHEPLNTCDRSLQGDARSEANPALDQDLETPTDDQVPVDLARAKAAAAAAII